MKRSLFLSLACVVSFTVGVPGASGKQKSGKPAPVLYHATLYSPFLNSPWPLEIVVEEVSSDEELKELAQAYATGGERALTKAMDKLHKGYCDLGPNRMVASIVQSKPDGANRRVDVLAKFPSQSRIMQYFAELPDYPYIYIQIKLDEHGIGKGTLTPKTRVTFNPQGQVTLGTRASEPFQLTLAQQVK